MKNSILRTFIGLSTAASMLAPVYVAKAAASTYVTDDAVSVAGITLVIKAGSVADGISISDTTLTVTVPNGDAFEVRTTQSRNRLDTDGLVPNCDVQRDRSNRVLINGPVTARITPAMATCPTEGYLSDDTTSFSFDPISGVQSGIEKQLLWASGGRPVASVRLRLSVDGGITYPTVLADDLLNNNFYNWDVPSMPSSSRARLKLEGYDFGRIVAMGVSDVFSIDGTSPEPEITMGGGLSVTPYDYEVDEETRSAATIGINQKLIVNLPAQVCHPDSRIKTSGSSAVYYCGADGKRYVFPNLKTYQTWYGATFAGIIELEASVMAKIPIGGNVTYRPGTRMVKLQTANDVFAVAADGTLRYVTEKAAIRLYGAHWNTMIDDLPDTFFVDYQIGTPVQE